MINLSVGEPDFNTPQHIKDAAKKAIDDNFSHYSPVPGYMDLRQAICAKLKNENGLDFTPEQIVVSNGAKQSICNTILALVNPGDEVILPAPYWVSYVEMVKLAEGKNVIIETGIEQDFKMTPAQLEAAITPKTKLLIFPYPNNPTGAVMSAAEMEEIAAVLRETNVVVLSDEIYSELTYGLDRHVSIASLPGMKERTFTMNGMSKAYAMDGWRLGYVAAPEEYILTMNKFHQHNTTCAPSFVQAAAIAALTQEKDEVQKMVKEYQRRRDYAVKAINEVEGISCICPKGAFYIFINCKSLGMKSAELSGYLLENAKIALVPGDVFGPGGEGYLRMSFATSYDNVVEGCAKLKEAVEQLRK